MTPLRTRKVEPIGRTRTQAFVNGQIREVWGDVFPLSRGNELRDARVAAEIGCRTAARAAGISPAEWTDLERGARVPEDWGEAFIVIAELAKEAP